MPELPEVETYVRDLHSEVAGRQVIGCQVLWLRTIAAPPAELFPSVIVGQRFGSFSRRGKYMLLSLESGDVMVVHLRMTGKLLIRAAGEGIDRHARLLLDLDDGRRLDFIDPRKFGRIWLVSNAEEVVGKLGPEPLGASFTADYLAQRLYGRNAAVKSLLLDQTVAAGIGNIYADEALHIAQLHPLRSGGSLSLEEIARLHVALRAVLQRAIDLGGSSLGESPAQNYLRPGGVPGEFQEEHRVYGRTGQPCLRCGAPIQRVVIGQRSAHFCPQCQR